MMRRLPKGLKRLIVALWLGFWIASLVIGCQPAAWDAEQGAAPPVVLKLSGWGASPVEQQRLRQVLQHFEAQHPTIRVRFEVIADQYMDVIKTRLIGDAAPDVFYLDALEAPFLMDKGVLEPLNDYIDASFALDDIEPMLLRPFQLDGQIYGLPKDYSTLALFYNQTAFREAGIQQPPRTWEELQQIAQQLTRDRDGDGTIDQYGLGITPELARLAYVIRAYGGEVVTPQGYAAYASAAAQQGLQQIIDQYRNQRTAVQPADVGTHSGSEMFGQGKVAMVIEGNWAIPFLQDTFPELEFATAEVPLINQQPGTMVFTVAYVMSRQSPHKAEAWQLISYLTGQQGMAEWTGTGFALPTRRSVAEQLQYDRDPLRSALVAGVEYATPWQVGPYPHAVMTHFDNQFISALLGEQPLSQALQRAQASANAQIQAAQ